MKDDRFLTGVLLRFSLHRDDGTLGLCGNQGNKSTGRAVCSMYRRVPHQTKGFAMACTGEASADRKMVSAGSLMETLVLQNERGQIGASLQICRYFRIRIAYDRRPTRQASNSLRQAGNFHRDQ